MTPNREMDEERFLGYVRSCYTDAMVEVIRKELKALRKSWERKAEAKGVRKTVAWFDKIRKNELADAIEGDHDAR